MTFQPDRSVPLSVSSIESDGVMNNSLRVSVSNRAPKRHTTEWGVVYQDRDVYRTGKDNNDACRYALFPTHNRAGCMEEGPLERSYRQTYIHVYIYIYIY